MTEHNDTTIESSIEAPTLVKKQEEQSLAVSYHHKGKMYLSKKAYIIRHGVRKEIAQQRIDDITDYVTDYVTYQVSKEISEFRKRVEKENVSDPETIEHRHEEVVKANILSDLPDQTDTSFSLFFSDARILDNPEISEIEDKIQCVSFRIDFWVLRPHPSEKESTPGEARLYEIAEEALSISSKLFTYPQ